MHAAQLVAVAQAFICSVVLTQVPEELARRLKDPDADTRRLAAEEAGKRKVESAIPALAGLLEDADAKVRRAAADALVRIGPRAAPALAGALRSTAEEARLAAVSALYQLAGLKEKPTKEVLDALSAALKDGNIDVRIHAASTLGRFGANARGELPALFTAAKDTSNLGQIVRKDFSSSVTEAAIQASLKIDPDCGAALAKAALPDLIAALKSKDQAVVQAAGFALAELGPHAKPAVPALQEAQKTAKGFAASAVTDALKAVGGREALKSLFDLVKDRKAPLEKRLDALRELARTRSPDDKVVSVLIEALEDPEPRIRVEAADAVPRFAAKAKKAIPLLLGMLDDEDAAKIAARTRKGSSDLIAEVLQRFGKDAVPGLIGVLEDDKKSPLARFRAARALAGLGRKAKSALPALEAGVKDARLAIAVESACGYVRAGGDIDKALPVLREGLKNRVPFIAWTAAYAVERLGARAKATAPDLKALLEHKEREVRIIAARALSGMGSAARPAVPAMAALLKSEDGRQRFQVIHALEKLGPDARAALPVLIERLDDLEQVFPQPVLVTIGNLGPAAKDAVPALLKLLENKERHLTDDAVETLSRIGPAAKAAVPRLITRLKHKNEYSRARAARALGQIGPDPKEAIPDLKKLLKDESKMVRVWAAFALVRITRDGKSHLPLLLELWGEDRAEARRFMDSVDFDLAQAFELLGAEARPALDLLLRALLDEKTAPGTHQHVARALGQFHDDAEKIVPGLITLLQRDAKRYDRIRNCQHAAEALGLLGPKARAAVPHLRKLLDDEEDEIVEAALRALEKIEGK
jgi:HEAT repeat protein